MTTKRQAMPVVGLTGGIGMGKSTVASILRGFGLPVHDADKVVHELLQKGGKAVAPVARRFPGVLQKDAVDRKALGKLVFGNPTELRKLERILHPLVQREEREFLLKARQKKAAAAILEIPLLFETKGHERCDYVICVTAPATVQKARVMRRRGMTKEKLNAILARQLPDSDKRKRADFVVDTDASEAKLRRHLRHVVDIITGAKHA